jgi:tetratricopeptide (TPR) repeat protein
MLAWQGRNALYRMARYEEAIKAYDRVIEIVPPYLNTACEGA